MPPTLLANIESNQIGPKTVGPSQCIPEHTPRHFDQTTGHQTVVTGLKRLKQRFGRQGLGGGLPLIQRVFQCLALSTQRHQ